MDSLRRLVDEGEVRVMAAVRSVVSAVSMGVWV
jgi:hypothetical protein